MNKITKDRGFFDMTRAYYHRDQDDPEIMVGIYSDGGGTEGEFAIKWHNLGNKLIPCLEVFEDAWGVLAGMPDLVESLGKLDGECPSADNVIQILSDLGFKDCTPYERPKSTSDPLYDELDSVEKRAKEIKEMLRKRR